MKESQFQKILVKAFRESGALVFNLHGHAMQVAGIPDLYVAHKIWTGWLELKIGTNKLTKLQQHTIKSLEQTEANVFVLHERKPSILVKNSDDGILHYIPFMSNDLDGIMVLKEIASVTDY